MEEQIDEIKYKRVTEARNFIATYLETFSENYKVENTQRFAIYFDTLKALMGEMVAQCVALEKEEQFLQMFMNELKKQITTFREFLAESEVKH